MMARDNRFRRRLRAVNDREVVPAPADEVRAVFGKPVESGGVSVEPLAHTVIASATVGIWRVRCGERSAVVKVLAHRPGGHENWRSGEAEDHWYYWRREAAAYESGLLGSLGSGVSGAPGGRLRAPDCYLVAERHDGSVALWIEDLRGAPGPAWPIPRYGLAARQLGRVQGTFAAGRSLPDDPWLSRGWLRAYLAQRDRDLALVGDPSAWRHPLVAAWFPDPPVDELAALRRGQQRFLRVLDGLPPTLSHLDLHPANMFDVEGDTAVVDWAFVGVGAVGEDAGNLVPDAVLDFHVPPDRLDELHAAVADGYAAGLRDAGCDAPRSLVRLAMAATVAAKYAWIAPAILRATTEGRPHLNRRPVAEALAAWAPTVRFILTCAEEARSLSADRRVGRVL
jgi:hypothetical protein